MSERHDKTRSSYLDWARVLAAQTVLIGHLRNEFLPAYDKVADAPLWFTALAAWAGFGSVAVTVFFAISGLQVGGQIMQTGRSFAGYSVDRIARFMCVLLPLILICKVLSLCGLMQVSPASVTWHAALINLLSLQVFIGGQFADNYPLWSLANEWCYYFVLPAVWLGVKRKDWRIFSFGVALCAFYYTLSWPGSLIVGALIWFMASIRFGEGFWGVPARGVLALLMALGFMVLERGLRQEWIMIPVGLFFLFSCYGLSRLPLSAGDPILRFQKHTFSLYVWHVPLIFLLKAQGFGLSVTAGPLGFFFTFLLINLVASGLYWLFERHYILVRSRLRAMLSLSR